MTDNPYTTTDLALITYLCMLGKKVVELKETGDKRIEFTVNITIPEGKKYQDDFLQSQFLTYFTTLRQVKYILHQFKDRQLLNNISEGLDKN